MSNYKKAEGRNECRMSDKALESATGGTSAYNLEQPEKIKRVDAPIHIGCGSTLVFQQNLGVYYCPKCRKEVPFNEVLK